VFSAGTDKSLKVWDVKKFQLHHSIEVQTSFYNIDSHVVIVCETILTSCSLIDTYFLVSRNIPRSYIPWKNTLGVYFQGLFPRIILSLFRNVLQRDNNEI